MNTIRAIQEDKYLESLFLEYIAFSQLIKDIGKYERIEYIKPEIPEGIYESFAEETQSFLQSCIFYELEGKYNIDVFSGIFETFDEICEYYKLKYTLKEIFEMTAAQFTKRLKLIKNLIFTQGMCLKKL